MKNCENKQIAFFGNITAGITHEMKNVLAIIKESSGLMEDFLYLSKATPFPNQEKFQDVLATIKKQIQRGLELTTRLNRFAHDPDQVAKKMNLNDMTEQLIGLAQRFARLQNVVLKSPSHSRSVEITTRPVLLQMALFTGIQCCLNIMPSGGQITLYPQMKAGQYFIHISCDGNDPKPIIFVETVSKDKEWFTLQELVAGLGGSTVLDEKSRGLFIYLPEKIQ